MAKVFGAPWGSFVAGFINIEGLGLVSPDTPLDLRAGDINQLDPDADILRLLGLSIPKWIFRNTGSTSAVGPLRVGDTSPATPGYDLDVVNDVLISGDLTVLGTISGTLIGAATALEETVTNGDGSTLNPGELVQTVSGALTVARTLANNTATVDMFGVVKTSMFVGGNGLAAVAGVSSVQFETGLALTEGQRVYLSPTIAGNATNVAPSLSGQIVADIGIIVDASGYIGTLSSNSLAKILLDKKDPVVL